METPVAPSRAEAFPFGLRVLVVDDDPTWLKILEKMLRKCSYEVTTCGLAREALELLRERKERYDIVISDVNMPDMDGFKLLEHVGLEMDLPVIMMSIDGETSRVMKGVQHGACDYLLKPVRMKELRNIWQHVYRKKMHEVKEIEGHEINEDIHILKQGYENFDDRHCLSGADMTSARKRKDLDNKEHMDQDSNDPATVKKARVVWSVDLHQKFVNAVNQIGFDKVGPKKILDLMNVPGLTRENVASHLQKYRLYLSRLQKQHEERTIGGNGQSNISSKDPIGSFDLQNLTSVQQNAAASRFGCTTQKIQAQGKIADVHIDDSKSVVSQQVTDSKKSMISDVPDSRKVNSVSQLGLVLSFKGMMPTVNSKSCQPAITKPQSWNEEVPVMQFMQYPKHNRERCDFLDDYACLPKPDQEHQVVADHSHTPPSIISSNCNAEKDMTCLSELKPIFKDYRSGLIKTISPVACTIDSVSVQVKHGIVDSRDVGSRCANDRSPQIKDSHSDQPCNQGSMNPPRESSLKSGAELVPVPEDLHLCSLQGIGCLDNVGPNSMDIFQFNEPTSLTELHGNWYDGLESNYDYLYDSVDYPLMDECLFA